MDESKKILLSVKLSCTITFSSELEKIEYPDEIEQFLLDFCKLKLSISSNFSVHYVNDDQDLLEILEYINNSNFISLFHK